MANRIAIGLDRRGIAEMSCIAGVGGSVSPLVQKAKNAEVIIGIDGCPLACVKACLQQQGLAPTFHYELTKMGVKKKFHEDFEDFEAQAIESQITDDLKEKLPPHSHHVRHQKSLNIAAA